MCAEYQSPKDDQTLINGVETHRFYFTLTGNHERTKAGSSRNPIKDSLSVLAMFMD
jgi:hypothetical protein